MKLLAAILLLTACTKTVLIRVHDATPTKVEVTKLPEIAGCYFPDLPEEPKQLYADAQAEPDVFKRMYVHRREFQDLLDYMTWWQHWAEYVQDCLKEKLNVP